MNILTYIHYFAFIGLVLFGIFRVRCKKQSFLEASDLSTKKYIFQPIESLELPDNRPLDILKPHDFGPKPNDYPKSYREFASCMLGKSISPVSLNQKVDCKEFPKIAGIFNKPDRMPFEA